MPVTAKLSRRFYEQLGDDIATELVDWFNAVDATYQQQLREINDLNWERFKAHLDAEIARLRSELRAEMAAMRNDLQGQITALRVEMAEMRADIIKWMFVFWCGNMIGLGGLIIALKLF